ncbi:UvrD-helicase domain-containing protein [Paraburkholderia sp. JHI869]|uniref:UvrD-helicase domain-containing protein n=1 Tax=Paraburkholderia sp. JHI869 TaxID=3112959 RepID=UPI0031769506
MQLFGDSPDLTLSLDGKSFSAAREGDEVRILVRPGIFWTALTVKFAGVPPIKIDGLPNRSLDALQSAVAAYRTAHSRLAEQKAFNTAYEQITKWLAQVAKLMQGAKEKRRWITHEEQQSLLLARPKVTLANEKLWSLFQAPHVYAALPNQAERVEKALKYWEADWPAFCARANRVHIKRELVECKDLFDQVEKSPLTEEQALAVICFDNRVQVVAAAGSGKTSTMAGKAAYAVHRGIARPDQILMLAFNSDAAGELVERSTRAFARIGIQNAKVAGKTFHALGLDIIGKATGRKPKVPDWAADTVAGNRKLAELVDGLKDRSPEFRTRWDLFRLVFGRDLPQFGVAGEPDTWNKDGTGKVLTLRGDPVRSQEECTISDWLFYNGVNYEYERDYEFDTATAEHRQYTPDFYYPDIRLYHEHFALNAEGEPPSHFEDYLKGVQWKRAEHARRGTQLIETTSHMLRRGNWEQYLERELTSRGIVLDPNPARLLPQEGRLPLENEELISLIRTFISHVKNNSLSIDALLQELRTERGDSFMTRHAKFLELVGPVMCAWDSALAREGGIDFDDMINMAADYIESGRYDSPYRVVMADEFQDTSRARARLCRALVTRPGSFFFAVGDDWQAINRFAGADVSVMGRFIDWFGHGQVLRLERTFRCPQELCNISSRFVSKNPAQLRKRVRSETPPIGPVISAIQVERRNQLQSAISRYLERLHRQLLDGTVPSGRNGRVSVFVLGRFNYEERYVPTDWSARYGSSITLTFSTMHSSKGAEADYVILPAMLRKSFPDQRTDDPVLAMAMPKADTYRLSEERRLFYVALTRARRSVAMFTVMGEASPFLDELVADDAVKVVSPDGALIEEKRCPACKTGVIVQRHSEYGSFLGCSAFPLCEYKPRTRRTRVRKAT